MPKPDRLTALDTSFLHLEQGGAHMHVASVLVFAGEPPSYDELVEGVDERLHLVPRYRQKLAFVPLQQGRPVWVDDPYFNLRYHVRHSALPAPGSDEQLKRLAGRLFALELDREKPLWEIHLVEGLAPGPRASPASRSSPRRTTRSSTACRASTSRPCSSTPRPTRRRSRPPTAAGRPRRRPTRRSCWPTRSSSA